MQKNLFIQYGIEFSISFLNKKVMKRLVILTGILFFVSTAFSQDTSINPADSSNNSPAFRTESKVNQFYNRNRTGSSSPQNDTYQKNNYGAGSVTTDPTKVSGVKTAPVTVPAETPETPIYNDTRLGSSSPLYNTYEKNNYGAGAVTTNPNKSGSGSPFTENTTNSTYPAVDSTHSTIDSNHRNF